MLKDLETMKNELKPLEDQKLELQDWAERRTSFFTWVGLGNNRTCTCPQSLSLP